MVNHEKVVLSLVIERLSAEADGFEVIEAALAQDDTATDYDFGMIHIHLRQELDSLIPHFKKRLETLNKPAPDALDLSDPNTLDPGGLESPEEPDDGASGAGGDNTGDNASEEEE